MSTRFPESNSHCRETSPESLGRVAIIGMSGTFPESDNVVEFWNNLVAGKDCISEIPPDRWEWAAVDAGEAVSDGSEAYRWGGILRDVAGFDCEFFGISPHEARRMDPQHRLLITLSLIHI